MRAIDETLVDLATKQSISIAENVRYILSETNTDPMDEDLDLWFSMGAEFDLNVTCDGSQYIATMYDVDENGCTSSVDVRCSFLIDRNGGVIRVR